ncbi:MAG TPA: putative porin, partial [Verrucomicrobiota bacterium]|nr:putative porin [Verrucomicrobiota bacterium]
GFYGENDDFTTRNRWRYRARLGVTAVMLDNFEAGIRLGSGDIDNAASITSGVDPLSQNQSLQNNGSKKGIFIDLAYGKWTSVNNADWYGAITIGKMESPYVFTDIMFDGDYTPEGAAIQLNRTLSDHHKLLFNAGIFVLDESGSSEDDPYMTGAQLLLNSSWTRKLSTSLGVGWMTICNPGELGSTTVPNINAGNTRYEVVSGSRTNYLLTYDFYPVIVDGWLTYKLDKAPFYAGAFPIKIGGEYIYNCGASSGADNYGYQVGIVFGKAGKKRTWELAYTYKWLGANAWYEELVDSDFGAFYEASQPAMGVGSGYASGTNVKGHIVRLSYSPYDMLTLSAKAMFTELIDAVPSGSESGMTRLQVDAMLKF